MSADRMLLDAVAFAARAHEGHLRKDGKTPYVSHVFRVCLIVRDRFGFDDPRMLITALLHDTIEDTRTDFDDVEEQFGPEVARWVAFLTKDKRLQDPEREKQYIAQFRSAPWQVQVCKLADMFDNLTDIDVMPAERRKHSLSRAEQYFAALRQLDAPEAQQAIALVGALIEETRARLR